MGVVYTKKVYSCKKCGCLIFSEPNETYGRCPKCAHLIYPNDYRIEEVSDVFYEAFRGKLYPIPSEIDF